MMDFTTWLHQWLSRHPLDAPAPHDPQRYTAEVMARVRSVSQPSPAPFHVPQRRWFAPPALATVTAMLFVCGVWIVQHRSQPLAHQLQQQLDVLSALDEPVSLNSMDADDTGEPTPEDWLQELEWVDLTTHS